MKMRISNHLRKKRLLIILAILLLLILAIILLLGRKKLKDTGIPSDEMWSEPVSCTGSDGKSHFDGQQYQYEECWDSEYYDRDIGWLIMPMNSMADAEADLGYSIIVPDAVEGYDPPQIYVEDNDLFGIDENEPEVIVSNRELLIVRYRVPNMELETREDYVMEGGGVRTGTLIKIICRSLKRLVRSRLITILNILSMMKNPNLRWKPIPRS